MRTYWQGFSVTVPWVGLALSARQTLMSVGPTPALVAPVKIRKMVFFVTAHLDLWVRNLFIFERGSSSVVRDILISIVIKLGSGQAICAFNHLNGVRSIQHRFSPSWHCKAEISKERPNRYIKIVSYFCLWECLMVVN